MKNFIYLLALVVLAGCSSVPPYVPPQTGKIAKIEYVVKSSGYGGFGLLHFEAAKCTKPKALIDGKEVGSGEYTLLSGVNIPAGKPIRLMPAYIVNNPATLSTCTVPIEFTPKENTTYTIEFVTTYTSCGVALGYWDKDKLLPEPSFRTLEYNKPFSINGPFCKN